MSQNNQKKFLIPLFARSAAKKRNVPPGTPVHVGLERDSIVRVHVCTYDGEHFQEQLLRDVSELSKLAETEQTDWISVDGVHNIEVIEAVGSAFHLHPLILEDIANTTQRPKVDEYEKELFVVLKMLRLAEHSDLISVEQVSVVLGDGYVLSFQEEPSDLFDPIRERLSMGKGHLRTFQADYLAYRLLDAVIDSYFEILEQIGTKVEELEHRILGEPDTDILLKIHSLKRQMLFIRRAIWPLRDVVAHLERSEFAGIQESTHPYLRDLYDHVAQVMDNIDTFRDMLSNLLDNYLSLASNRVNDVMKVLTIVATIFIPLTFIAGVYGMNFKYMPELDEPWGYPAVLLFMGSVLVVMVFFFRRKKWL